MATRTREEIRVGELAIRFLVEGQESAGSVAMFEFAAVLDAAAGGPPDLAAIAAVMRRHGLTPAR